MRDSPDPNDRVLAIDPTNRGFGFAILEGPHRLVDWGLAQLREATVPRRLARVAGMIEIYAPDALVIEDWTSSRSRRGARACELLQRVLRLAVSRRVRVFLMTWPNVKQVFAASEPLTKGQLAAILAAHFEELVERLPPRRKPWMSEDERFGIFDAAALALAYFSGAGVRHQPKRIVTKSPTVGIYPRRDQSLPYEGENDQCRSN